MDDEFRIPDLTFMDKRVFELIAALGLALLFGVSREQWYCISFVMVTFPVVGEYFLNYWFPNKRE